MTQDEIIDLATEAGLAYNSDDYPDIWDTYMNVGREEIMAFAKLVAAKAIKELESQEPVAWRTFDGEGQYEYRAYENNESYADDWNKRNPNHKGWVEPLYTHSPQRTWVGLTDEEMETTFLQCGGKWYGDFWKIEDADFHPFLRTIEAKLKEKNA